MDNNARILWEDICCYLYCEMKKSSSRKLIQEIFLKAYDEARDILTVGVQKQELKSIVECELMPVMLAYCRIEYLGLMDMQVFVEHGEPERVDDGQAEYFASAADEYLWRSRA